MALSSCKELDSPKSNTPQEESIHLVQYKPKQGKEEHYEILEEVLKRLQGHNIHARITKCSFFQESVDYLGHLIDSKGIHPLKIKVEALLNLPAPMDVAELKAFLGMANYYGKYIAHLSTMLDPLNHLLKKGTPWKWTKDCENAFRTCKQSISEDSCLVPFDPKKPIKLDCDASSKGIGAVLSHIMEDGRERPIAFASRSLTKAERGYSQLDKEALSLIFGVKKFHMYLYVHNSQHYTFYQKRLVL
ncbi:hypothetical protein QZH41_006518 [Actinostola sp. cb2023]|nr:hypothetical protein QZH41_006518 [Actinostola sp. cb2023]